jgi:hypothetical protein
MEAHMKSIILTIALAFSFGALAGSNEYFKDIKGTYRITSPDDGLLVRMKISANGKIKMKERFIGSGKKSSCKNAKAKMLGDDIIEIVANCKVRNSYSDFLGKKDKRQIKFAVNLTNIVAGNSFPLSDDGVLIGYEGMYYSDNTREPMPVLIMAANKEKK